MSATISAQEAMQTVGAIATGPAGFGIFHVIASAATVSADGQGVAPTAVDQNSLRNASAQNERGMPARRSDMKREQAASRAPAMPTGAAIGNAADARSATMLSGRLGQTVDKVLERAPGRMNIAKGSLNRVHFKHYQKRALELAKTPTTGTATFNLSEDAKRKLADQALEKGEQLLLGKNTPQARRKNYAALSRPAPAISRKATRPLDWAGLIVAPGYMYG